MADKLANTPPRERELMTTAFSQIERSLELREILEKETALRVAAETRALQHEETIAARDARIAELEAKYEPKPKKSSRGDRRKPGKA